MFIIFTLNKNSQKKIAGFRCFSVFVSFISSLPGNLIGFLRLFSLFSQFAQSAIFAPPPLFFALFPQRKLDGKPNEYGPGQRHRWGRNDADATKGVYNLETWGLPFPLTE